MNTVDAASIVDVVVGVVVCSVVFVFVKTIVIGAIILVRISVKTMASLPGTSFLKYSHIFVIYIQYF